MSPSTTRDTAVKWTAYALACLLLLFGHELTLAHLRVWGIAPFLPPLLPAVLASMEDRLEGFVFALAFGVLCDLALTAPLPCLYTIAFPLTALLAALIARSVLQPGILCSLAVSTAAFVLVDLITVVTLLAVPGYMLLIPLLGARGVALVTTASSRCARCRSWRSRCRC